MSYCTTKLFFEFVFEFFFQLGVEIIIFGLDCEGRK